MRVSACGWLGKTRQEVQQLAQQSAECTHNHPEGIKGAVAVADCIFHARNGFSKQDIKEMVEACYGYNLNQTSAGIRVLNSFNETCQITVPQAIICYLESNNFEQAIRLAVSIGGDSDTIAAIAGSIAEAEFGIPQMLQIKAMDYLPEVFKKMSTDFIRHAYDK